MSEAGHPARQSMQSLRDRQKIQTRLQIVDTSIKLFLERGFDNVPVETICACAGISRATFFNHFPQKDLVLSEIVLSRVQRMRELAGRSLHSDPTPGIPGVINLFLAFARENEEFGEPGRALVMIVLSRPHLLAHLAEMRRELIAALTSIVLNLRKHGQIVSRRPARVIAEMLFGVYLAASLEWVMGATEPGRHVRVMKERFQLALEGIR